jgi:hypothetical protein
MNPLSSFQFDIKSCLNDLSEFEALLKEKSELGERADILPFFKAHLNLLAYVGSIAPGLASFNRVDPEYTIYGDFRADAIVGDWDKKSFCLIEFEDAKADSIFKRTGRSTKEWSPRFEHGYSQVVDWMWKIDDFRQSGTGRSMFGSDTFDFTGMLIIGRDIFLDEMDRLRLNWRTAKSVINSQKIVCMTFDQLASELRSSLATFGCLSDQE